MNNENQVPELPKMNNETSSEVLETNNTNPVILKTIPEEEKKENEAKKMLGDVKDSTSKEVQSLSKFFKDIKGYITSKNSSELLALLWRLLLIAGFVIILYVPFQIMMDFGSNLFILFGIDFTAKLGTIWNSIWYLTYSILAVVLFFILCKDRYYKLVKQQEDEKKIMNGDNK